jgi:hypothetical protein
MNRLEECGIRGIHSVDKRSTKWSGALSSIFRIDESHVLYQGMTLVVPKAADNADGLQCLRENFSPEEQLPLFGGSGSLQAAEWTQNTAAASAAGLLAASYGALFRVLTHALQPPRHAFPPGVQPIRFIRRDLAPPLATNCHAAYRGQTSHRRQ